MLGRTIYFTQKAVGSIRESPWVSALTTATITVALLVVALYALTLNSLAQLALVWGRAASVTAYLADGLSEAEWERLRVELAAQPGIDSALLMRPNDALARFRRRGDEAAALVEGVDPNVLPASVALMLKPGFTDVGALAALARGLARVPGVAEVDYGKEEFDRVAALLRVLRYGGIAGVLLIALATAFIVSNTIRLTVYARREDIGILGLVGATAWFIRIPFVIEGALWGFTGGVVAVLALWALDRLVAPQITLAISDVLGGLEVRLFDGRIALAIVIGGMVLAATASGIAVRRFLDVELR